MIIIPLSELTDAQVWRVTGGGAAGSAIKIFAGTKSLRQTPIPNDNTPNVVRLYESNISIYTGYSPWSLIDYDGTEICDWTLPCDLPSNKDNELNTCMTILIGQRVVEVDLSYQPVSKVLFSNHVLLLNNVIDKDAWWSIDIVSLKISFNSRNLK